MFGYAGSGKSTVLRFALDELGLSPHQGERDGGCVPGVVTATFTGKAAYVLRSKGTPARTIHSLIYSVLEATEEEVEAAAKKVREAETGIRTLTGFERTAAEAGIEAMRQALAQMKKPRFALNPQSDAADAKLIVLDEVSMVGEEMARDLMSFGKPILVLGDPGQLPPIKGEGAFTRDAPDVMLTEIHRQAAESAIIRLATMARQGEPIGFGEYDRCVAKMRKGDVTPAQALRSGPADLRHERDPAAAQQRHARAPPGFGGGVLPSGPGEKIICLKNQNDIGLINGMFVTLEDVVDEGSLFFSAVVTDEDGKPVQPPDCNGAPGRLRIYKGHFEDHVAFDRERHDRDWREKRKLTEATFGWAITAHKAQGSQWENVIVWDDGLGQERARPPALALHRDHPRRAGPGHPRLRAAAMIDLNDVWTPPPRIDLAAVKAQLAATAADWLPDLFPQARLSPDRQDAALRRPLGPAAAEGGLVRPPSRRALRRLGLRLLDRRARRADRPDLSRHRADRRRALRGGGPARAHGSAVPPRAGAPEGRPHARGPPHPRRLHAARRQPGRDLSAQPRSVGPGARPTCSTIPI